MGSSSQDLAGALLIIFKTNSSVTGSKVSKGFPAKEVSGQAVGFGGGKLFRTGTDTSSLHKMAVWSDVSPWCNFVEVRMLSLCLENTKSSRWPWL